MAVKPKVESESVILPVSRGQVTFAVLGSTPLIFNRMAEKAKRELIFPRGKKTQADKASTLKHMPVDEYRDSVYRNSGDACATRLCLPAPSFKGAMSTAALDMPGTRKSEIGRRVWVVGTHVDLYGVPELYMAVVRSADMNRTPDIRTRAIVPNWACTVTVEFVIPLITADAIAHLMAAAGLIAGVGDFRQEKGKGNFGQFQLVDLADARFQQVIATGGRAAQDQALLEHRCYDDESQELLEWHSAQVIKFGRSPKKAGGEVAEQVDDAAD